LSGVQIALEEDTKRMASNLIGYEGHIVNGEQRPYPPMPSKRLDAFTTGAGMVFLEKVFPSWPMKKLLDASERHAQTGITSLEPW
jgi:hypothetical protein